MIKFFQFIKVNASEDENRKKIEEEWGEWQAARGTPQELEELVDIINALCNEADRKFGHRAFKTEQVANINDVARRYGAKKETPGTIKKARYINHRWLEEATKIVEWRTEDEGC